METCALVCEGFKVLPTLFDILFYLLFQFIKRPKLDFVAALLSKNNVNIFAIDFLIKVKNKYLKTCFRPPKGWPLSNIANSSIGF